jgi:hypothetical protein
MQMLRGRGDQDVPAEVLAPRPSMSPMPVARPVRASPADRISTVARVAIAVTTGRRSRGSS